MLQRVLPPPFGPSFGISSPRTPWALHTTAASRRLEQQALAALPAHTLMQRAGLAIAQLAQALAPHAQTVWVACGPGNNGGDGLEAAIHLHRAGLTVIVSLCAEPSRLPPDARQSWHRATDAGVCIALATATHPLLVPPLTAQDLAIDALLGLGSQSTPNGSLAQIMAATNTLPCPVLAVDLPSGLHADTGQPRGEVCSVATHTLALLTLKPGLFTGQGRDHAGQVWFDDLCLPTPSEPASATLLTQPTDDPQRRHAQHKGSFGDVIVVGGAAGMVGAALLAARAALAAGAGRVHVDLLDDAAWPWDAQRPELMFRRGLWQHATPSQLRQSTVVAGCGGGESVAQALPRLISHAGRLVLDADALNAIAADPALQTLLATRGQYAAQNTAQDAAQTAQTPRTVMTPHPLEAARLLGIDTPSVQADRVLAAQTLAHRFGAVVVLKGSGTVIAAPTQLPCINSSGNAALATGGTGDVLAGWLGGYWSASSSADVSMSALQAAAHCVWWHGHAADTAGHMPLQAADLINAMHALRCGMLPR